VWYDDRGLTLNAIALTTGVKLLESKLGHSVSDPHFNYKRLEQKRRSVTVQLQKFVVLITIMTINRQGGKQVTAFWKNILNNHWRHVINCDYDITTATSQKIKIVMRPYT